eukprot:SAG31_NODE_24591_length_478_cov_0.905013_1_plen_23_part_10
MLESGGYTKPKTHADYADNDIVA